MQPGSLQPAVPPKDKAGAGAAGARQARCERLLRSFVYCVSHLDLIEQDEKPKSGKAEKREKEGRKWVREEQGSSVLPSVQRENCGLTIGGSIGTAADPVHG